MPGRAARALATTAPRTWLGPLPAAPPPPPASPPPVPRPPPASDPPPELALRPARAPVPPTFPAPRPPAPPPPSRMIPPARDPTRRTRRKHPRLQQRRRRKRSRRTAPCAPCGADAPRAPWQYAPAAAAAPPRDGCAPPLRRAADAHAVRLSRETESCAVDRRHLRRRLRRHLRQRWQKRKLPCLLIVGNGSSSAHRVTVARWGTQRMPQMMPFGGGAIFGGEKIRPRNACS
jgi:hypothetical protein